MLKGFGTFLLKELKELVRDPKILLPMIVIPLVMFPVLGAVMGYAVQTAQEQAIKAKLIVVNNDGGGWSNSFVSFLKRLNVTIYVVNNTKLDDKKVLELLSQHNATQILEIPKGFSENVTAHFSNPAVKASLRFYSVLAGTSIFEGTGSSVIDVLINQFNRAVAPDVVYSEKAAVIKGEIKYGVDPAVVSGLLMSQSIALPLTVLILLSYAPQIAAASMAIEKEEKTLETLLTLPMDRLAILWGKLSSSIIVAAVGAVAYMAGYSYMFSSIMAGAPASLNLDLASLGLVPSAWGYLLLGLSLFVAMISALALAVILSAFAEDVRSAQSLVSNIYPLVFVPSIALIYLDINTLPFALKLVLFAIPFSHPVIASKAVVMGDYWTAGLGIVYVSAFTLVVMYVASKLFATEKILTAKLKIKGLKTRRSEKPAEEI
ncbi:MAG: ABC transporter permease [Candidatus Bathyarchaeota archaeon]|nr:ABC transporter permease [Candidatus Bathyarchaeota archaeon]MDW8022586.1 ABC transporter permease [Nitrososphaerota archaeon]MDW8041028.1 ABC transporter permease [Nitrososphaerota archaeon]